MTLRDFINNGILKGEAEELAPGNCIFRQGEEIDFFYLVTKGRVAMTEHSTGIARQLVAPPDFLLGINDLLHDTYSFTAYTLEPTEVIRIRKEAIQEGMNGNPLLRLYLLKLMSWDASLTKIAYE